MATALPLAKISVIDFLTPFVTIILKIIFHFFKRLAFPTIFYYFIFLLYNCTLNVL